MLMMKQDKTAVARKSVRPHKTNLPSGETT